MMKLLIRRVVLLKATSGATETTRTATAMFGALTHALLVQILEEGRRHAAAAAVQLLVKLMRVQLVVATDDGHVDVVLLMWVAAGIG